MSYYPKMSKNDETITPRNNGVSCDLLDYFKVDLSEFGRKQSSIRDRARFL